MNSLVSLKYNKTKRRKGKESWVPRNILKHKRYIRHALQCAAVEMFFKCLLSINSSEMLEKPCMDVDQHHMSPASGLSVENFALMFQVSVH